MVVLLIAVFYFFMIRPQTQKAKEEENYRRGLQKGDRVMTNGGIHATVVSTDKSTAIVEIANNVRAKVLLSTLQPLPGDEKGKEK